MHLIERHIPDPKTRNLITSGLEPPVYRVGWLEPSNATLRETHIAMRLSEAIRLGDNSITSQGNFMRTTNRPIDDGGGSARRVDGDGAHCLLATTAGRTIAEAAADWRPEVSASDRIRGRIRGRCR